MSHSFDHHTAHKFIAFLWVVTGLHFNTVIVSGQAAAEPASKSPTLEQRVADKVVREQIQPRWNPDGTFWYRVKTGPGIQFEWVFIAPENAAKTVVFTTDEWQKASSRTENKQLSGSTIQRIITIPEKPDALRPNQTRADQFRIRAANKWWIWNQTQKTVILDPDQTSADTKELQYDGPKASLRQGPETSLTFINRTRGNAHVQWIDPDGKPKGYGHIAPGKERSQHTFGGHVWRIFDDEGNDLVWVEAEDIPTTVEIQEPEHHNTPEMKSRSRKSSRNNTSGHSFEISQYNIAQRKSDDHPAKQITTDGREELAYRGPISISPDGRFLLAKRVKPEQKHTVTIVDSSPDDQLQPKTIEFQYLKPGDQIEQASPFLFDLKSGREVAIDESLIENPWSLGEWHWAEDSSEAFFLYNRRGHQIVRMVGLDPQNGKTRIVAEEKFDTFVDYTNKIWHHWLPESKKMLWMSERSGWNHLYLIDVQSGTVEKPLTTGQWLVRKVEKVDTDKRQIWFYASGHNPNQDPYQLHLARVNFDGTGLTFLTEADGNHTVTFSPDDKFLIDRYSRVDLPPVYELRRATDGKFLLKLEEADALNLTESGWTMPERFSAKGRDGKTDIFGVIYRPYPFDPNKKYPIVEEIYAGPHGAFVPKSWGLQMRQHKLAELGFIVVQIDGMGTNWRSKAFHDVAAKNLADAGFPDRKIWIKEAARTRPYMDLSRVGIYGGSAGGQNAMRALIDHHDFYKVAVADCGCHDNRMDKIWWNELWLGWPVGPQYELNSNSVHAHRLQGKLLLIVGELDRNVDPASTMQVVNALVKSNKSFELLIIPGAGHGAAETPYGNRRRTEFLIKHLKGPL